MKTALAGILAGNVSGAVTPYLQRFQYGSTTQSTTHTGTFPTNPTNGNILIVFAFTDKGAITTPLGWQLDLMSNAGGIPNVIALRKFAGVSEPASVNISCVLGIMTIIGFEFPVGSFSNTKDDTATGAVNQANLSNLLSNVITSAAVDLAFAVAGFLNTGHVDTGDGPFSFDSSFSQLGYALALHFGTSGTSIELVVGFRLTSSIGTYTTNVVSTLTEGGGTTAPWLMVAYK